MPASEWLLAIAVVIVGAIVQGLSGIGSGFIMVPLLALIDLRLVPGALIFASLSISGPMAWIERGAIRFRETNVVLAAIVPGAGLGAWLLSLVETDRLGMLFGGMILLGVGVTALGARLRPNFVNGALAGVAAGTMGAASGIGAPIVALLYQHQSGPELRATLAYVYTMASTLILIPLAWFGRFGLTEIRFGAMLVPGFLLGLVVSRRFVARVDRGNMRIVVLVVSAISALSLIANSL